MELMQNYWYIILDAKDLKTNKPLSLKRHGKNLVLWKDDSGKLHCLEDRCPHRGAALSAGTINKNCVVCPFHGIAFNGEGECVDIPYMDETAVKQSLKVKNFRVCESYGFIWLWHGDTYEGQTPQMFDELKRGYAYHSMNKQWNTHYSRVIENQLDYYHLPFVHKNTIGRGFKPVSSSQISEKMTVEFKDEMIRASMKTDNRPWTSEFSFIFPNAWQLKISPFMFLFVAFCPVDEDNTVMILRSYLKGKKFIGLKRLLLKSSPLFNYKILAEDERVVLTQTPKAIRKVMEEHLLALDKPIAIFRRHYFSRLG